MKIPHRKIVVPVAAEWLQHWQAAFAVEISVETPNFHRESPAIRLIRNNWWDQSTIRPEVLAMSEWCEEVSERRWRWRCPLWLLEWWGRQNSKSSKEWVRVKTSSGALKFQIFDDREYKSYKWSRVYLFPYYPAWDRKYRRFHLPPPPHDQNFH